MTALNSYSDNCRNQSDRGTCDYVVQVWNGRRWAKVRGAEGGPWTLRSRAERVARSRQEAPRRSSSTEGMPHRVVASQRREA